MALPHFSDSDLRRYGESTLATPLESNLAETLLEDRRVLRELKATIEPMARQVISPKSNVFTRQLALIDARL